MTSSRLQRYYDRNTDLFLRIGSGGPALALHRGLWPPGVHSGREAARQIHHRVADAIQRAFPDGPRTVLDLGCGVGGTLFDLAERFPGSRFIGVTLSGRQITIAREQARRRGLAERCSFLQADFETISLGQRADVIIAIESFAHASRPDRFLATCRQHLASRDARVIVVDDFLDASVATAGPAESARIETFRSAWNLPGLGTLEDFLGLATRAGLRHAGTRDLSSWIRTDRLRDRLVSGISPVAARLGLHRFPFWANVIGGNALSAAIRDGQVRYCMITCTRPVGAVGRVAKQP
ncbi:Methyltransferase type 11 [Thioalkalivibrio nitratireducens DSM 14787]|uniref:Methyltransferase type 11 n=2 Tax=Thioalkalivibrio nitratireducens TaxID=186931 RepID=L0DXC4_THIND|nr:Methyltransferase type 11 [Thioalkalivibrio nitratireducens DSM 14787]